MSCSSFSGVRPVACISPTSGSEIFPSDRTGMDRDTSGSFHTLMAKTSSLPITKLSSCGLGALEGSAFCDDCAAVVSEAVAVLPDPACAQSAGDNRRQSEAATAPVFQDPLKPFAVAISSRFLLTLCICRLDLLFRFLWPDLKLPTPRSGVGKGRIPKHSCDIGQSCKALCDSLLPASGRQPSDSN